MKKFKASQPFIDSYAIYYGDGFKDCPKQVKSIYPRSPWTIPCHQLLPTTLSLMNPDDTIFEEIDDSIELEPDPKNDSVVLSQPVADPTVIPSVPSTKPLNVENPSTQDVQDKNDENPQDAPASLP